ncbi:CobW family GTP-binding protein [Altericista sp. CCNU0014]|uniref:CobW family GTP-binding protein n=1 Tax=Altericista sp. CCNU0014 TaxID=3082949 RepID=UPI00384FEDD8
MFQQPKTPEAKLPVTIITGFLGSGKTTLLNHILAQAGDRRVAILVNEFGDINIDSQFLIALDENIIELNNGCICCTINNNLAEAVWRILARRAQVDYLVIETTGVADPLPIMQTFLASELWSFTHLDAVLAVVDAETFTPEHFESTAALRQVAYADIVLLNKTDLVSDLQIHTLETYIQTIRQNPRILHTRFGNVPLSLILDVALQSSEAIENMPSHAHDPSHAHSDHLEADGFMAVSFESDRPFKLKRFQEFLDYHLPAEVFRAKGVLWFVESPNRHLFQLSGKRFSLQDDRWRSQPKNQAVWIGRNLNPLNLQQLLTDCLETVRSPSEVDPKDWINWKGQ